MTCYGITFLDTTDSIRFSCSYRETHHDIFWITLNKRPKDKGTENYGRYKIHQDDPLDFDWIDDDKTLCELSEAIRNYVDMMKEKNDHDPLLWYKDHIDMRILRRTERLYKLLNNKDENNKDK